MDWISTLHYGLIRQREWLRRAREPYRAIRVRAAFKWVRNVLDAIVSRARRSDDRIDQIAPKGGPALPKGKALA